MNYYEEFGIPRDAPVAKIRQAYKTLARMLHPDAHSDEAVKAFRFLVDSIPLSILKDRAQFRIAEIYQTILNKKTQAIEAYEKLLAQFPNSLYVEESRKRIRLLRGDNL